MSASASLQHALDQLKLAALEDPNTAPEAMITAYANIGPRIADAVAIARQAGATTESLTIFGTLAADIAIETGKMNTALGTVDEAAAEKKAAKKAAVHPNPQDIR